MRIVPCRLALVMKRPPAHFSGLACHTLIVLSMLPEASVLPSGLYATETTGSECPVSVASSLPVCTSHSLIVLSKLPEASVVQSGLNATDNTESVCPLREACTFLVCTSHSI